MNRRLLIEVVVASASWGVIALAIALHFGISAWLWPLCGAFAGGIGYRFSDLCYAVCTTTVKNFVPYKGILIGCSECLYVFGVLTLAFLPAQTLIFWYTHAPNNLDWGIGYIAAILWTMFGMVFVVSGFEAVSLNRRNDSRPWTFPLFRRLAFLWPRRFAVFAESFYNDKGWTVKCEREKLTGFSYKGVMSVFRHAVSGAIFFNSFIFLMLPMGLLLLMDALASVMLACAPNERIAVLVGAATGCCVAMLLSFAGITSSITLLIACGISGGAFGGMVYAGRAWLTAHPPTFRLPNLDTAVA